MSRAVKEVLRLPRLLLLGLDVDGTLAPIVDNPARAAIPPPVLDVLGALSRKPDIAVALITGRDEAALRKLAPIDGIFRVVEHGRVTIAPDGARRGDEVELEWERRFAALDATELRYVTAGARYERKAASRAVHVRELLRRAPEQAAALLEEFARAGAEHGFIVREGRAVVELVTTEATKAGALWTLADQLDAASVVFVGDDLTDIGAIEMARARGGLGMFVTSDERPVPPIEVDATFAGPAAVGSWLVKIERGWSGP